MYEEHLDAFSVLWKRHEQHREKWCQMSRHAKSEGKTVKSVYKHNGNKSELYFPVLPVHFVIEISHDSPNRLFACQGYGGIEGHHQSWKEISAEELCRSVSFGRDFDRTPEVRCLTDPLIDPRS
jgi:hypothetical protein